jgi:hypothetical protein
MVAVIIIVLAGVLLAAAVGWLLTPSPGHNQDRVDADPSRLRSDDLYRGSDRPAGPDAEVMDPEALGGDQRPPRV